MASFQSLNSLNNIIRFQNIYQYVSDYGFWFGLNKLDKEKGPQYTDNSAVSFLNWEYNGQDDRYGRANCVDLRSSGKWRYSFCYLNQGWMCSIPKVSFIVLL